VDAAHPAKKEDGAEIASMRYKKAEGQTQSHRAGQAKCRETNASDLGMIELPGNSDHIEFNGEGPTWSESDKSGRKPRSRVQQPAEERRTNCPITQEISDGGPIVGQGVHELTADGNERFQVRVLKIGLSSELSALFHSGTVGLRQS
jgi:hypothetical protein